MTDENLELTKITDPITKKINEVIPVDDLKKANDKWNEVIDQIPKTKEMISEKIQKQATSLKTSMEKMIPDLNATNAELSKNLESLLKKVDDLKSQNPNTNTNETLGEIKVVKEFEADKAALVVITKDMILTQLYMNYLKYFRSILILIRDTLLPNFNDIQEAKKENKEIMNELEGVLNDPEIQEKWNIILKTLAIQLSRFIFIVVMFSDILMQKLGDVGNRFIVEFVNQNIDAILRMATNTIESVPVVGGVVASVDSFARTLDSVLNLGLITSYSFVDSVRIPADAILRGKFFKELKETKDKTLGSVDDLIKKVNDTRNEIKVDNKKKQLTLESESVTPVETSQGIAEKSTTSAQIQKGNAKKIKRKKQKKTKKRKRKKSKQKKTKKRKIKK